MKVEVDDDCLRVSVASEDETEALGRALAELMAPGVVVGLFGALGVGKTRLVRALCEALAVDPCAISSPTFVLMHEYAGRLPVYHFDAYRLKSPAEFEALGAREYFELGGACLIEWADRIGDCLPADAWTVSIERIPEEREGRLITLDLPLSARSALIARLLVINTAG